MSFLLTSDLNGMKIPLFLRFYKYLNKFNYKIIFRNVHCPVNADTTPQSVFQQVQECFKL